MWGENMQKCRLDEEAVYAFKVIDENEIVDVEYEKMLRRASQQGKLKCEGCGTDVIFKFGNIKAPHFAHKHDFLGGGCSYSKETEEHIQGKKLLFNLMLKNYPDIQAEMRYRFSNGKRADLYFKFDDGQQLVIEFQRELNSLSYWEDKREFYKSINVNDLWIASGKRDEFESVLREYEFIFQHRLFLNDNNNMLLVLDVARKEMLIASKMIVNDEETNDVIMDKMFWRVYSLNDLKILPDGTIDCKFNKDLNEEKDRFVQDYLQKKKRKEEEQERFRKELEERNKQRIEDIKRKNKEEQERLKNTNQADNHFEKTDVFSDIGYTPKSYGQNSYNEASKKSYNNYFRNDDYYKDKVNKAILGYRYGIKSLVNILVNGGSTEYANIKKLFEVEISKGNEKAKKVYDEVMKLSGLD